MTAKNENQWCFSFWAGSEIAQSNQKAALLKNTRWNPGDKITISFLDGDPGVQNKVIAVANQWVTNLANLTLEFRKDTTNTNIRISFLYKGSWSVLGTTCKSITDQSRPTMNFGWLNESTGDEELRRVVLHEFGHALGLIHEHLNPLAGIQWNINQVRADLSGPPNQWSDEVINTNMFQTFTHELDHLESRDCILLAAYDTANSIPVKLYRFFSIITNFIFEDCLILLLRIGMIVLLFLVYAYLLLSYDHHLRHVSIVFFFIIVFHFFQRVTNFCWHLISRFREYRQDAFAHSLGYGEALLDVLHKYHLTATCLSTVIKI